MLPVFPLVLSGMTGQCLITLNLNQAIPNCIHLTLYPLKTPLASFSVQTYFQGWLSPTRDNARFEDCKHQLKPLFDADSWNRKNDLILIMTPEKQDKTLELSKHWSVDSTPARNEVIMKRTYPVKLVKCDKICSNY